MNYKFYINKIKAICSQTKPCNNLFDCVENESEEKKNLTYDYDKVDVSVQIILPNETIYKQSL